MPAGTFRAWNQATGALTAAPAAQLSAATVAVRTMLQIAPAATTPIRLVEWGYEISQLAAAPVAIELIDTGTVFATGLTAHVAAGLHKINAPLNPASTVQLGTALTGYTNSAAATSEGTITATRLLDHAFENGLYVKKQYPLGREPEIPASNCLRIRVTPGSAAAVSVLCYVEWEE